MVVVNSPLHARGISDTAYIIQTAKILAIDFAYTMYIPWTMRGFGAGVGRAEKKNRFNHLIALLCTSVSYKQRSSWKKARVDQWQWIYDKRVC